jgi:hypothetical protein
MTLITPQNIRDRFDLSLHKDDDVINMSISAIENSYLKPMLTKQLYAYLLGSVNVSPERPFSTFVMSGGLYDESPFKVHINGLIDAVCTLVYADLLIKQTFVTRYGAANKTDARSQNKEYNELNTQISRYANIGKKYIEDVRAYIDGLDAEDPDLSEEKNVIELIQLNEAFTVDGILNEWI